MPSKRKQCLRRISVRRWDSADGSSVTLDRNAFKGMLRWQLRLFSAVARVAFPSLSGCLAMLRFLSIEHLAVIERLEIDFDPGFNVLTGETGAGKSMLVEAVGLLLGGRASERTGANRRGHGHNSGGVRTSTAASSSSGARSPRRDGAARSSTARSSRAGALKDLAARLIEISRAARASGPAGAREPSRLARRLCRLRVAARTRRRRLPAPGRAAGGARDAAPRRTTEAGARSTC